MDTSGAVSEWLQHKLNKFDVNDITLRTFLATCMELAHAESRTEIVAALEDAKAEPASFFALVKESVESYKQKVEAAFAHEALCPHCWRASAGNDDAKSPEYQHIHITVVGYGMAGKARVRDGQAFSGHFVFDGLVSRHAQGVDVPMRTWEDLLTKTHVIGNRTHAIAICTENTQHFSQAMESLEHGYNVLVEYPPAMSSEEWHQLVQAAAAKNLILHVEWMALFSAGQKILKGKLERVSSPLQSATVRLRTGWTATPVERPFEEIGSPVFAGISRLVRILDLFGPVKVVSSSLDLDQNSDRQCTGFTLNTKLVTVTDGLSPITIEWIEERKIGMKRNTLFEAVCENGDRIYEEPTHSGWQPWSLFAFDLCLFAHEMAGESAALRILARNHDLTSSAIKGAEKIQHFIDVKHSDLQSSR